MSDNFQNGLQINLKDTLKWMNELLIKLVDNVDKTYPDFDDTEKFAVVCATLQHSLCRTLIAAGINWRDSSKIEALKETMLEAFKFQESIGAGKMDHFHDREIFEDKKTGNPITKEQAISKFSQPGAIIDGVSMVNPQTGEVMELTAESIAKLELTDPSLADAIKAFLKGMGIKLDNLTPDNPPVNSGGFLGSKH